MLHDFSPTSPDLPVQPSVSDNPLAAQATPLPDLRPTYPPGAGSAEVPRSADRQISPPDSDPGSDRDKNTVVPEAITHVRALVLANSTEPPRHEITVRIGDSAADRPREDPPARSPEPLINPGDVVVYRGAAVVAHQLSPSVPTPSDLIPTTAQAEMAVYEEPVTEAAAEFRPPEYGDETRILYAAPGSTIVARGGQENEQLVLSASTTEGAAVVMVHNADTGEAAVICDDPVQMLSEGSSAIEQVVATAPSLAGDGVTIHIVGDIDPAVTGTDAKPLSEQITDYYREQLGARIAAIDYEPTGGTPVEAYLDTANGFASMYRDGEPVYASELADLHIPRSQTAYGPPNPVEDWDPVTGDWQGEQDTYRYDLYNAAAPIVEVGSAETMIIRVERVYQQLAQSGLEPTTRSDLASVLDTILRTQGWSWGRQLQVLVTMERHSSTVLRGIGPEATRVLLTYRASKVLREVDHDIEVALQQVDAAVDQGAGAEDVELDQARMARLLRQRGRYQQTLTRLTERNY